MTGNGLCIGDEAPDFTLRDQFGQDVRLSDFRGRKAVALIFFPFAFTGVCTGELAGVRAAAVASPAGLAAVDVDKPADLDAVRRVLGQLG